MINQDKLNEYCGVIGVFNHPEASNLAYLGLYALQHRGQESTGIVSADGKGLYIQKGMGLVSEVFNEDILKTLKGDSAIGHNRYSTTGSSVLKNAQPFVVDYHNGSIAVAHNGNIVNAQDLREDLESHGSIFQSSMDTEIIIHLIARATEKTLIERMSVALKQVKGAYSLVFLTENRMIAVRDPHGFRPLVMGRLKDAIVFASETCALDLIEATFEREVEPGEIISVTRDRVESFHPFEKVPQAHCIFEFIYFARPDSQVFNRNVYDVRKNFGRELAKENPVEADMVIPVPDSGVPAAIGYSQESGIPFEMGLIRNHYVGRTFIEPQQSIRHFGVKIKLNALKKFMSGKRVIVIDDSIVRGTTSRKIVKMLRDAGAKEVHLRISSPPIIGPCYYGIDTPTRQELIASSYSIEEINKYITSDTLAYLSIDGLFRAAGFKDRYCMACFTEKYPVEFPKEHRQPQLSLFDK